MKRFCNYLIFLFLFIINLTASAQIWLRNMPKDKVTLKDYQNAFYDYWKDKPVEKGQGYSLFKRWEWFWEQRVLPDGTFPEPTKTRDEWQKFEQSRNNISLRQTSNANWQFRGPSNSPGGQFGLGRLNCIAFHPNIANTFWVGSPAGGLWKTTDGGQTWSTNTDYFPVLGISDIAIDPINPNTMYVATGDGDFGSLSSLTSSPIGDTKSIGVLKSTNGGLNWSYTGLNWDVTSKKLIRRLLINPINPQILIAAASDGLWRTTNGGASWTLVQGGYFMDLEFKPGNPNVVYATTFDWNGNAQIYRSTNAGAIWSSVISFNEVQRIDLAVSAAAPDFVDAVCSNTEGGLYGLWFSNNSGQSFSRIFNGDCGSNNLLSRNVAPSNCKGQGYYDLAYAVNPNNPDIIWLGGINTYRSGNGGASFQLKTFWNPGSENPGVATVHADKHFIAFHPLLNNTVFECNDGGLYKTTDGGNTWTDLSDGLGISQIYRIGVSQTLNNSVICGLQDNGSKELRNTTWGERTGGDGMECMIDYTNPNVQYTSYQNGILNRTLNAWQSEETVISNNIPGKPTGAWVTPFVMHPSNPSILYAGYDRLYRSTNRGDSWTAISPLLTRNNLRSICVAPSNPNTIYAASFDTLYMTYDGGLNWSFYPWENQYTSKISYITVDPNNSQIVYVTNSGYESDKKVFKSSNGGFNWSNYSFNLPNVPVNCIVYQKNTDEGLYVGTDVGVFYTNRSMPDWIPYQNGLPNVVVTELEISYNNNKLWAATFGRGLWNSDLYSIASNVNDIVDEKRISLFPNPSNGRFTISAPQDKMSAISVFNAQGVKVFYKEYNAQEYVNLDLGGVSAGVYNIQILLKNKRAINKRIVIQK